jgi:hypothetical protein
VDIIKPCMYIMLTKSMCVVQVTRRALDCPGRLPHEAPPFAQRRPLSGPSFYPVACMAATGHPPWPQRPGPLLLPCSMHDGYRAPAMASAASPARPLTRWPSSLSPSIQRFTVHSLWHCAVGPRVIVSR